MIYFLAAQPSSWRETKMLRCIVSSLGDSLPEQCDRSLRNEKKREDIDRVIVLAESVKDSFRSLHVLLYFAITFSTFRKIIVFALTKKLNFAEKYGRIVLFTDSVTYCVALRTQRVICPASLYRSKVCRPNFMWTAQSNPTYNEHVFHPQPSVQRFERAPTKISLVRYTSLIDRNLLTFRVQEWDNQASDYYYENRILREQKLISLIFSYHEFAMKIFAFPL